MKYILILVWLSASGEELHKQNFVEYSELKTCELHRDDARSQKGKKDYPVLTSEEEYTLKDAYCKEVK
ncbi:MAG: hypothetical protein NPINA01_23900 [Nitrospinaceae bacterium]|nr:MAG: hypothetical protein NPINA01_23900 [Nitrospinaceae bacterium]